MDPNDLHAALTDLAGTAVDDPGLLASVHHRARRNRRRRVVITSGSALAVLGVALAAGEGGFSSGPPPPPFASSPTTSTTTTSTTSPPAVATPGMACRMQLAGGGDGRPGGAMGIQSWTGSPPPVGQAFDATGTVTAVGSDTLTITLNTVGGVGGTLTIGAAHVPPLARTGASAQFQGTRTGPTTYQLSRATIMLGRAAAGGAAVGQSSTGGGGGGQVSGDSPNASDPATPPPAILSWTGSPPAVGQLFHVTGTVTAVGSDALTITLNNEGGVGGVVTLSPGGAPPLASVGASAEIGGTRTGPNTYQLTQVGVTQDGPGYAWSGGRAGETGVGPSGSSGSSAPASPPTIVSWTGSQPAVGQTFDVSGTVSTIGSDAVTITLDPGAVTGVVTLSSVCEPPSPATGASVELGGTRTGADTYRITNVSVTQLAIAAVGS